MNFTQLTWYDLRKLRVNPPGLAAKGRRKRILTTALAQFEQLTESASRADLTARPILIFYGLAQAGQALVSAYSRDQPTAGHGLKYPSGDGVAHCLKAKILPTSERPGTIQAVASAIGSPMLSGRPR